MTLLRSASANPLALRLPRIVAAVCLLLALSGAVAEHLLPMAFGSVVLLPGQSEVVADSLLLASVALAAVEHLL
jgi:hypothetical protein